MTHESMYRYGYLSEDYGSCSKSGKVRISYFDPRTGEPCEEKPEPLSKAEKAKKSNIERYNERMEAQSEAAEIMRNMEERKRQKRNKTLRENANRQKRQVLVDGVLFDSVKAAAEDVGTSPEWLCHVLKSGAPKCKGRRIEFAESEG